MLLTRRSLAALMVVGAVCLMPAFADDTPAKPEKGDKNAEPRKTEEKAEPKKKDRKKKEEKPVVAHVRLHGDLGEAPVGETPFGATSENLRGKLDHIRKAKTDPKVKALLVEIEGLGLGLFGFGKVEEVRHAIADFRSSGKKAYCYLEEASGIEYLIALACDEICMPESGSFEFLGLRVEMSFYKEMLDKIGVQADFLTMGEAKGAAEPFTRTSMSPENRKQYELVLDDLYENGVVRTIVNSRLARKWSAQDVKQIIDTAPHSARKSKELGLIDRVAYREALEADVKKDTKVDDIEIVRNYGRAKVDHDDNPFSALMKLMNPVKKTGSKKPKIALIYAVGEIRHGRGGEGLFGGTVVGSTTMVEAIRQAEKDDTVKAIVLRVDSPGGSALASDLIWHELRLSKKPTIATMGDVAASGGYYISMGCQKVFAEPGTLTGSIGVVGGKLAIHGLEEWAGIRTQVLARGKNSGALSSTFAFSPSERDAIKATMQEVYDQFLDKTVANRKAAGVDFTREKLLPLAGGRIWTGRQAKERALVDELGTLADAIAQAKVRAKMPKDSDPEILVLPEPVSFLERLLDEGHDTRLRQALLQRAGGLAALPEGREHLRALESALRLRGERVWMMMPAGFRVR